MQREFGNDLISSLYIVVSGCEDQKQLGEVDFRIGTQDVDFDSECTILTSRWEVEEKTNT